MCSAPRYAHAAGVSGSQIFGIRSSAGCPGEVGFGGEAEEDVDKLYAG